jgi:WD40 repeat protein
LTSPTSTLSPAKDYRVKRVSNNRVSQKKIYQATALSPSCDLFALVTRTDFQIFSISFAGDKIETKLKSCGFNDGRFGESADTLAKSSDDLANPRGFRPDYTLAVMSDKVLCIACAQNCIDVHEISTGRRLQNPQTPEQGQTMAISRNGQLLAIAMENGRLRLYKVYEHLMYSVELGSGRSASKTITCIAFSPNSAFFSAATSENIIYTYSLGDGGATLLSQFSRRLDMSAGREPQLGLTSLAL